jgi:putative transposase
MLINRAYKTELDPNNKQVSLFRRCCGASRYVYNWGLAEWKRQYEAGEKPSRFKLCKQFNAQKDDICPWIRELPYAVTEAAFINLGAAFQHFFRRVKGGAKKAGYPHFKKRGTQGSFQVRGYRTEGGRIWLGRAIGWVRLKERDYIPPEMAYLCGGGVYATVSERAGRWFVSIQAGEEIPDAQNESMLVIGVDFGIKSLAVCSDGTVYENPQPLRDAERELARLQRELSRRMKGGSNWCKTKRKIQRCHAKIANIRTYTLHQISHDLIVNKHPAVVAVEDLNVSGMAQNHHLAQAVLDCGFYELRRQIEYKARWHGVDVVLVDRWFPSSKTCSRCGCVKDELPLSERTFRCDDCGAELDRDYNAALNLAAIGKGETHPDCLGS